MNAIRERQRIGRYSAKNSLRAVNFYYPAAQARSVELAGDFNLWCPIPMQRRIDGWWFLQVLLSHGHHQYRFLVDGEAALDPKATGTGHDERGEEVSIVAVS
jgi:1,4-alpha-glucan branching enzyme